MKNKNRWKWLLVFGLMGLGISLKYAPYLVVTVKAFPYQILKVMKLESRILPELQGEAVAITSDDGVVLQGLYCPAQVDSVKGTIIFIHGIRSSKEMMSVAAREALFRHYHVLLVDLRAHGESQGDYCTFGYKEKNDMGLWVHWLETEKPNTGQIGLWGHSLGAAIAVQTLAQNNSLAFGVIESCFSDYKTVVGEYARRYMGFNFPKLSDYLAREAARIAGMNPQQVSPKTDARKINQPMVVVHGLQDKKIPPSHGLMVFENLGSEQRVFIPIENANHSNIWIAGGRSYFDEVFGFIDEALH